MVVGRITGVFLRDEYLKEDDSFDPMAAGLLASIGAEDYLSLNSESIWLAKSWG
jgi:hypothetical protein